MHMLYMLTKSPVDHVLTLFLNEISPVGKTVTTLGIGVVGLVDTVAK